MTQEKERRKMPVDKDTFKEAAKEALKEWLDEKYLVFGKWSLHGLLAMALAALVYWFMVSNGWHK
jgi:hypothetical protein